MKALVMLQRFKGNNAQGEIINIDIVPMTVCDTCEQVSVHRGCMSTELVTQNVKWVMINYRRFIVQPPFQPDNVDHQYEVILPSDVADTINVNTHCPHCLQKISRKTQK